MRDTVAVNPGPEWTTANERVGQVFIGHKYGEVGDVQQGLMKIWMGSWARGLILVIVGVHDGCREQRRALEDCASTMMPGKSKPATKKFPAQPSDYVITLTTAGPARVINAFKGAQLSRHV